VQNHRREICRSTLRPSGNDVTPTMLRESGTMGSFRGPCSTTERGTRAPATSRHVPGALQFRMGGPSRATGWGANLPACHVLIGTNSARRDDCRFYFPMGHFPGDFARKGRQKRNNTRKPGVIGTAFWAITFGGGQPGPNNVNWATSNTPFFNFFTGRPRGRRNSQRPLRKSLHRQNFAQEPGQRGPTSPRSPPRDIETTGGGNTGARRGMGGTSSTGSFDDLDG